MSEWRRHPVGVGQCPAILTDFGGNVQWTLANAPLS